MTGQKVACECGSFIRVPDESAEDSVAEGESVTADLPEEGWYIHRDGESIGPKRLAELQDMARRGELEPKTKVYNADVGDWRAASSVPGLSEEFPPPAVESESTEAQGRRWYVRAGKEKYGPYTADRVREMVQKNQLRARSSIWNAELDDWVELRSVEPFSTIWGDEASQDPASEPETQLGPETKKDAQNASAPPASAVERAEAAQAEVPREEEKTPKRGLTQNIKELFGGGGSKGSQKKNNGKSAQIPSTVLTVEYVDDGEGIEAALAEIGNTLESLHKTTKQVQEFTSRLTKAMDQQNRRTNEAIELLRRRLDKLYRRMEQGGFGQSDSAAPPMPPMPEEEMTSDEEFGVPEEHAEDNAHQRAWQVAQVMASDLEAYHPDEVREGVMYGNLKEVLGEHIEEARETYEERTPERISEEVDYFDMALDQLKTITKRRIEEEEAS
jgi:hypothetical protein